MRWIEDAGGDVRPSICAVFTAKGEEYRMAVKYPGIRSGIQCRQDAIDAVIGMSADRGFIVSPPEAR